VRPEYSGWFVTAIQSGGPADGRLEVGDHLLASNGDERAAVIGASYWRHVPAGETYRVDVERHGVRQSVDLLLPVGSPPGDFIFVLYSVVFFACGAALGLARPGDRQVRVIALCLTVLGITTLGPGQLGRFARISPARMSSSISSSSLSALGHSHWHTTSSAAFRPGGTPAGRGSCCSGSSTRSLCSYSGPRGSCIT
jgi:hypothetical protein